MHHCAGVLQAFGNFNKIHLFAVLQPFSGGHRYDAKTHLRATTKAFRHRLRRALFASLKGRTLYVSLSDQIVSINRCSGGIG